MATGLNVKNKLLRVLFVFVILLAMLIFAIFSDGGVYFTKHQISILLALIITIIYLLIYFFKSISQ